MNVLHRMQSPGGAASDVHFRPHEIPGNENPDFLDAIISTLKTGIWEASQSDLRLISLRFGNTDRPILGLEEDQIREGLCWHDVVCPLDKERVRSFFMNSDSVIGRKSIDYRIVVESGELQWVRHHIVQRVPGPDGQPTLRGIITAIHEQKHLEWECLRVSERECNRIGQELHDDLCQVLAGLSYLMHVIGRRAKKADPSLGSEIDELNLQVVDAMERTRSMAHGLFPSQLNYATIRHALKALARQIKTRFSTEVTLELPRGLPSHAPDQIIHIYRIVQEAASNSVRHGKATAIRIVAVQQNKMIRLSVEDNGCGLPLPSARPEGIGMHAMSYRAKILGGEVAFKNHPPKGAIVQLSYPIAVLQGSGKSRKPSESSAHENLLS